MKTRMLAFWLAAAMLLSLSGCGKKETEEPPVQTPVEKPEPEPEPEPEPPYVPAGTNPLTGLPMEPEDEEMRPVAVMLNNLKAAQPQLGISQADIIYEVTAEGGITRMLGLYQTMDGIGTLGSIRSTRPYYIELALGHDALLVHAGGSQEAYSDIYSWKVDNMDGVRGGSDAEIFWRDRDRQRNNGYEHSLITSGEKIQAYLDQGRFDTEHRDGWEEALHFAQDGTPAGGERAEHITLRFSAYKTGTFDYEPAAGQYLAGQYGENHVDAATGMQVAATNVLVKTVGEGKGTFFCGGKAAAIQWSREDRNSPFVYTLEDGTPLTLGQGKSYICLISPKVSTLKYE